MNHMNDELPGIGAPSPEVAALIRRGVERVQSPEAAWVEELNTAMMRGSGMSEILTDPVLTATALRTNLGNLARWASANMSAPGMRVPAEVTEDTAEMVHELVRRGLDAAALDAFRTAQNAAWQVWMEICFGLTDDPRLLRALLEVTSASIATFIDDTVTLLAERIAVARAQLAGDMHARRRAALALILEGAPITTARAEVQLNYRLSGAHTAVVVSGDAAVGSSALEQVCEDIMAANRLTRRLTVLAGVAELWVWFPTADLAVATVAEGVRVAVGAAGLGREGFRTSHLQALGTHRLMGRLDSHRHWATYDELRLLNAMSDDPAVLHDFVHHTLGDLLTADPELIECLHVWFAEQCNASAAAARLFTHRNTVVRRLARAQELLPVPLRSRAIAVAAALEVATWVTGPGGRAASPARLP